MESTGTAAALLSGAAVVIAAIVAGYKAWHVIRQERDRTALGQYREVADRQQRQIERQDALIEEFSEKVRSLTDDHAACQVELAEQYGHLVLMHSFAKRVAACCRDLGRDPGDLPPLPERPKRHDREREEFEQRTLAQKTKNVQQLSGIIPPPPPPIVGG